MVFSLSSMALTLLAVKELDGGVMERGERRRTKKRVAPLQRAAAVSEAGYRQAENWLRNEAAGERNVECEKGKLLRGRVLSC